MYPEPESLEVVETRLLIEFKLEDPPLDIEEYAARTLYPCAYIKRRADSLAARGFVQPVSEREYVLRDLGEAWLSDETTSGITAPSTELAERIVE